MLTNIISERLSFLYLGAFVIMQLFHSRLLDMEWSQPTGRYAPRRLSIISYPARTRGIIVTAPFNNIRTLKFKGHPTNSFFAAVNQMFSGSSQPPTTAVHCFLV